MKPMINPWLFYLTDVLCNLKFVFVIFFSVSLLLYLLIGFVTASDIGEKPEWFTRKNAILLIIPIIIGLLIPEEKTVYKMLIASYTTPNNIEYVKETGKDLVDYIIEKANELERVQYEKDSK